MSMSYYLWEMRPYFRQVAGQLVLGSIAGFIMNTAVVLPAILLGQAIDAALAFERGAVGAGAVGWAALAFVGGTLLTEVPRAAKRWWLMTANARIRANIRADAWRGVIAWPMARLDSTPAGDVMARIIGDVEVLGVGVREFSIETWDTMLFSLSLMIAMLVYDPTLTVLALLPVPMAMLLAKATGRWVASRTTASREANASLTTALQEQLAGIRVLRLFGRTGAAVQRVDALSGEQADTNLALVRLRGGHIVGFQEPVPAPPTVPTGPVAISLHEVTFRSSTATAPALCDIWLDIPAGALVAVTGPVGAGKSALARALLGLYPLEAGQVLLDGCPLDTIPAAERAARTGYLPQDPYLFSGTVRENILLGSARLCQVQDDAPHTVREPPILTAAVACAALGVDLGTFPAGLETDIGELGIRVSGGQRQRMALARAIAAGGAR